MPPKIDPKAAKVAAPPQPKVYTPQTIRFFQEAATAFGFRDIWDRLDPKQRDRFEEAANRFAAFLSAPADPSKPAGRPGLVLPDPPPPAS